MTIHRLEDVRYWDGLMDAASHMIVTVAECVEQWAYMPGYAREGKLVHFARLQQHVDHIRGGMGRGGLTNRQQGRFRALEAKLDDAFGLIEILRERHEAMEREGRG